MTSPPTPVRTPMAMRWLESHPANGSDRFQRALLSSVDGRRSLVELESFARAIGLESNTLERLRSQGLIDMAD